MDIWILYAVLIIYSTFHVKCNPLNDTTVSTSSTDSSDSIDFTTVSYDTTVVPTQVDDLKITTTANLVDMETTTTATDITDINDNTSDNNDVNCSHCLNAKYFNHYYAKGCKPVFGDNRCKDCPKMFDCIEKIEIELGNNECLFNGSKFTIGERIPVPNPCQVCQCGYGYTHRVDSQPFTTIHCVSVECPENFAVHSFPLAGLERDFERVHNCYNVYESGKCCAVSKKCADPVDEEFVCQYNGKSYRLGEKIHPIDDKCKVCVCDQSWNSNKTSDNSGCRAVECNLEVDRQLRDGCLPIYHENTCCPVDYYCPEREFTDKQQDNHRCGQPADPGPCVGLFKRFYYDGRDGRCHSFVFGGCGGSDNNFRRLDDCQKTCVKSDSKPDVNQTQSQSPDTDRSSDDSGAQPYCLMNDKRYPIGHKLDIGQRCVDCVCRIPPEFTCVQRSCPKTPVAPNQCKVTYSPAECCPTYDCSYNKTSDQSFDTSSCPTPMCAKGCHFETYPDRCPTCVCKPAIDGREVPDYDVTDV